VNETLDYASPPQPRKQPYWVILFAAWMASVPIVTVLEHGIKGYLGGGLPYGRAMMLAMFAIVPAAIIASLLKPRWWVAAIVGGLCAPVVVAATYLLWR